MLMKVPSNAANDDDHETSPDGPIGDGGDFYEVGPGGAGVDLDAAFGDDFAEYMWMVNEEEFDKEEMLRLEEEALMELCLEAMFDLDPNIRVSGIACDEDDDDDDEDDIEAEAEAADAAAAEAAAALAIGGLEDGDESKVTHDLCKALSVLATTDNATAEVLVEQSNLNPLAEEFVPSDLPPATEASI